MGETAKLHSDLEALVGATIHDRYEVESLLGAGGMGAVFKARHTGLQRGVAIKVLHPEIGRDESVSKRFDREAHSASRLDHPNCVRVTDFGTTDNGTKYLVMELLEGGDLDGRLGSPWDPDKAVTTIEQVLHGLDHAHHVGIVHRDLKPENIFVTRDFKGEEIVKIVDFGIAKLLDEQGSEKLTRAGIVFGTPRYMSPEQAAGGKIDERTDLYAVGLILYELLAGHAPFQTDDAAQLLRMQIMAPPPPLPESVPPALAKVVEKLLEKSKMDRYASASEVLEALAKARDAMHPAAAAGPAAAAAPVVAAAPAVVTSPAATTPPAAPASSGSAWQPAPATGPAPAISGATLAAPAADLAAVSMSAHAPVGPTGSHPSLTATGPSASMSAHAPVGPTGSHPSLATGSHPSLATGSHPSLATGPHASVAGLSHPSMTGPHGAASNEPEGSRRWVPIALAGVTLVAVLAGVGMLLSSLDADEQARATPTEEPAAAVGQQPDAQADSGAPEGQAAPTDPGVEEGSAGTPSITPGPVRDGGAPAARPVRPSHSSDSSSDSKSKSSSGGTDSKAAQPKPSDGGSPEPAKPGDESKPDDSTSDSTANSGGLDPRQAEKEREAAAEKQRLEEEERAAKEREAKEAREESRGKPKGKGKGADKKKDQ